MKDLFVVLVFLFKGHPLDMLYTGHFLMDFESDSKLVDDRQGYYYINQDLLVGRVCLL